MEECIPCEKVAQQYYAETKKGSIVKVFFDFLNSHPVEGAEFMSRIK